MTERSGYELKNKKKSKISFIFKLLFILTAVFAVLVYSYFFPRTMELLDEKANEILSKCKVDINCDFFGGISDFSKESFEKILYLTEIIKMNTEELFDERKSVPLYLISCAAKFPLEKLSVTSEFGTRKDPITNIYDEHNGTDFAAAKGSDVFSAWPGNISETGKDKIYGNYITVKHSENFFTKYCHLSKITCEKGDFVNAKEKIGEAGDSGRTTGSHLHFEVILDGKNVDPMECFAL